jgi:2,3-dihydroxybenzoate-AMP ligase
VTAPALSDVDLTPWPDEDADRYRAAGYWAGETFEDWWRGRVGAYGDAPALVAGDVRWSYRELAAAGNRASRYFAALGIGAGERVVVQLPNRASFLPTVLGLFRIGAVPVFALPAHRHSEIEHLLHQSEAVAYVVADRVGTFDFRALARGLDVPRVLVDGDPAEFLPLDGDGPPVPAAPADPGAVAFLNLSGGSTGLPKLIPRTPDDYLYSVRASAEICGLGPDTRYLCVLPVAHNFSLSSPGVLGVLHAGGTVVLGETPEARPSFELIAREGVTITALVPPLAKLWLDAAARTSPRLPSLRLLQVGGARLADEVAARVAPTLGCRLQQVFGMAEGLVNYTRDEDPDELVVRTQGRPISPDDEIRVVDGSDVDVPPGEAGQLLTRGPYTIRGYWRAAAHNASAFTADGFYRTGDLVRRLPSGHLVVEGRVKDQINRGGEKVAVEELENHLLAHPAVLDAAVVAVPDPVLGQRTCAVLVARGEAPTAGEVRAFVRGRGVAEFKVPDLVRVVDRFPETGVGKTHKAWIRAALTPTSRDISATVPASVRAVGAPPPLMLPGPWEAVPILPGTPEAAVLADWMSRSHVAEFWDQAWPAERWDQHLAGFAFGDRDRAYLVRRDGEPLAYLEVYRAARDIVARHYPAHPHDLGLHIAIGDPSKVDRGFGRRLLRAAAEALLAADPAAGRVVAEPDVRNAMAVRAFTAAGYSLMSECDLGYKRAALVAHPRRNDT